MGGLAQRAGRAPTGAGSLHALERTGPLDSGAEEDVEPPSSPSRARVGVSVALGSLLPEPRRVAA